MSLSSKFLSPEDLSNRLDVVGQSSLRFNNSKAGLQSDTPEDISESAEKLKLEIEVDLSEIKNVSAEIEIELKLANTVNASIEADKEALAKEAINRDVIDYSINSFNNQMLAEQRGDMIVETSESSGMQSAMGTVSDGLRFVIENKKAILEKALEKLKQLFTYLVKKIKEYYRKGFYAFHKLVNLPSRVIEILSGLPQGQLVTPNMLSESTILEIEKGFGIFTLLNLGDSKKEYSFSFADDADRLRMEQVFSGKMFLDMEFAAKDGVLKTRDVDLLRIMSNKDVIKKYFNYSIPSGFDFEDDVVFPIVANADDVGSKNTIISFGIAKTNFYTEDNLDLTQATTSTFKAVIKPDYLKNISITLSTLGDMIRVNAVLEGFNSGTLKSIEDTQNRGLNALEKKVNSLNVADKDMQAKFKTFKGIYDVLNIMSITNLMGLINTYARATRALEAIGKDVTAHLAAQRAEAGLQSEARVKAGLQFFGLGSKFESNLKYFRVADYLRGSGYVEASWEALCSDVWSDEDFSEAYDSLAVINDNYKRGSEKLDSFKKVSPDSFIVNPKKYADYVEDINDMYEMNKEDIDITYEKEPELKVKALKFNEDMYKLLTKIHTLLNKNIRPMEA